MQIGGVCVCVCVVCKKQKSAKAWLTQFHTYVESVGSSNHSIPQSRDATPQVIYILGLFHLKDLGENINITNMGKVGEIKCLSSASLCPVYVCNDMPHQSQVLRSIVFCIRTVTLQ